MLNCFPNLSQAGYDHRGCCGRSGAPHHPAGSPGLLHEAAEKAEEEGDDEEAAARARGGYKYKGTSLITVRYYCTSVQWITISCLPISEIMLQLEKDGQGESQNKSIQYLTNCNMYSHFG